MRNAALLLAALLLAGCATTTSIPVSQRTRTYDAPKNEVFSAVVASFTEYGFGIQRSNQSGGIITTSYKTSSGLQAALTGQSRLRYNAVVRGDSSRSRVRLTITAQGKSLSGWQAMSMTSGDAEGMYEKAFKAIGRNVP
jgi:uncharacterized lipoprotein